MSAIVAGIGLGLLPLMDAGRWRFEPAVQDALTVFQSILIEAIPFLLLGSVVAYGIRHSSAADWLREALPRRPVFGIPAAACLGVLLPICECGNVPIARSLRERGLPAAYATTFLFSAPILNPAVFFSTWIAFQGDPKFIAARFILGFIIAIALGAYVHVSERTSHPIWRQDILSTTGCATDCSNQRRVDAGSVSSSHRHGGGPLDDFFRILPLVALGSLVTVIFQSLVGRNLFFDAEWSEPLLIISMMLLAFFLAVCSSADAFLALGYSGLVSPAALLAFLVFGPMVDAKNVLMYRQLFTRRGLILIVLMTAELVFIGAMGFRLIEVL